MFRVSVKGLPFLLLTAATGGAGAMIVATLQKRRHNDVSTNETLKIIFAPPSKDEPDAPTIEKSVQLLTTTHPCRPVFIFVVPDASAGKKSCGRVFDLHNRLASLFHCENMVFEKQLYYDLNPLANEHEVSFHLAKDISAIIDAKRDICRIVLPDGTVKVSDGSTQSLDSLFRGGQYPSHQAGTQD